MIRGNRATMVLLTILVLLFALVVGLFMYDLGTQNSRLRDQTDEQEALIQELITQNRGPRGDDGLSAYEIWLALGNTGTEAEFIESLRGPAGTNGIDGRDGVDGKPGSNGLSVGSAKCTGAGLNWYLTNGSFIGTTPLICIP